MREAEEEKVEGKVEEKVGEKAEGKVAAGNEVTHIRKSPRKMKQIV